MNTFDEKYWSDRWKTADTGWDVGYASTPLAEYIRQLPDKTIRILIPGAGNAWEGILLHELGFKNTHILDISPEPLKRITEKTNIIPKDCLIQDDFFNLKNQYDLILEQTFFCSLNPVDRRRYFEQCHALLKPGGTLAGVLFDTVFNFDHPPFGGSAQEYKLLFSDLFDIKVYAPCYNSIKPRRGREWFMILVKKQL